MPRFCQLGPNCVGPKKVKAPAGYEIGIIPGPPYNKDQRFCSKPCKTLYDRESVREKRAKLKARRSASEQQALGRSDKKIAKLRATGHASCPCCKESL